MRKHLTEIVFILDRSGSMEGLEAETISSFNSMLQHQKRLVGDAYITTILFDHEIQVLHDREDAQLVEPMTKWDYYARGGTALLDAIGGAIRHIDNIHKYARAKELPDRTVFVIATDGMENASRNYTVDQIRRMIRHQQENYGWEFLFLGANMDAVETAGQIGILADHTVRYRADGTGICLSYEIISWVLCSARASMLPAAGWQAEIRRGYLCRRR